MKRALVLLLILGFGSFAFAGGDWSEAKITKFMFNERAQAVFELEWVKDNGFLSRSDYKRLVFEFHNWPASSHRLFHQVLPWTPSDGKTYPLADVAACQNVLLNAFINKSIVKLSQTLGSGAGPALVGGTVGAAAGGLIAKLLNWFTEKHTKLSPWEIDKLKEAGVDPEQLKTEITGKKKTGSVDLFKGPNGDICVKPKSGKGPGEPTGINIIDIINGTKK